MTMKASVRHKYGSPDVLRLEEVEKPAPREDEVLIRVHAASANLGDWEMLRADPLFIVAMARLFGPKPRLEIPDRGGLFEPKYKVLGCDIAGRVEAVGSSVTQYEPGDEVFGMCGFGAFAEYVCVPESSRLAAKPASMTFEDAAALPQATFIALQGVRDLGQVRVGHRVLVNGAGGGAGTLAVQLAKSLGAEVTGVDNTKKLEMMRSIGADHVIDYTQQDFFQLEQRYDVVLDLVATHSIFDCKRVLCPHGIYIVAGGPMRPVFQAMLLGPLISKVGNKRVVFLMADSNAQDLAYMTKLVEAGKVAPIVDQHYPLSEVPEALRHMGEGRALGKVIITM